MRFNRCLRYIFLVIFIFIFKIDSVSAEEMTCEYESYEMGYTIGKNDEFEISIPPTNSEGIARIEYKGSDKKNYSIKSKSIFGPGEKHADIKDASIAKYIKKEGKCPAYIKRDGQDSIKILKDENKFINEATSYSLEKYSNEYPKYPLVLVKQNGKATDYAESVISYSAKKWANIMKNEKNSKNESYIKAEALFIKSVKESSIYESKISKNSTWSTYLKAKEAAKILKSKNNIQKNASGDYCYYYCSSIYCKNQKEGTAKTQCINSCNISVKPNCDSSYNACAGVQSDSQQNCIKNALSKNGLDPSYVDIRTQKQSELAKEIRELKKAVSKAQVSPIKITIGEGYKVKCEDVSMLHDLWVIIIIVAPGFVIVLGTFDFFKAIIAGDEQKMKKAWKNFPKRLLALVFLILVPQLISIVLSISNDETASDPGLMYCIINGGDK